MKLKELGFIAQQIQRAADFGWGFPFGMVFGQEIFNKLDCEVTRAINTTIFCTCRAQGR